MWKILPVMLDVPKEYSDQVGKLINLHNLKQVSPMHDIKLLNPPKWLIAIALAMLFLSIPIIVIIMNYK